MFKRTHRGTSLRENIINDGFFDSNQNVLDIIDDYNIIDISDDAIDFYVESFRGVGLRHINIYFQIKPLSHDRCTQIEELSRRYGVESNTLKSFIVFVQKTLYPKEKSLTDLLVTNSNYQKLQKAFRFINALQSIGITVELHPYNSLHFNPPFHGRYWLTERGGYIVDASLQTFGHGLIFAQLMDDENYRIIKEELFDQHIVVACEEFLPLTFELLNDIVDRIFG